MKAASWNDLPIELKSMVMHNVPDIPSLFNLVTADTSLQLELHYSFDTILPSVLANAMPQELQRLIFTLLTIREAGKFQNSKVLVLLHHSVGFDDKKQLLQLETSIKYPLAALDTITRIQKAVDYFTWAFARCLCKPPDSPPQDQGQEKPNLSATEVHRIQRALWRFQICCELSNSWIPSAELYLADSEGDDRIPRLMIYLRQFNPWEVEELNCIYDFLENMLERDSQDPRLNYLGTPVDSFVLRAPRSCTSRCTEACIAAPAVAALAGVRAKFLSQGLTFLKTYLHNTSPMSRLRKEQSLCFPSDEFIIPALCGLKDARSRFPHICEFVISSDTCPWTDNYGATLANFGWRFFSDTESSRFRSFAYLRQFGFCIWDEKRLQSWGVLNRSFVHALKRRLLPTPKPQFSGGTAFRCLCL
ncbi:hypothetical protein MMC16_001095 [Acarospora aff. strigata]|nr:hypothetical protein [Acarospora aff. strigata]